MAALCLPRRHPLRSPAQPIQTTSLLTQPITTIPGSKCGKLCRLLSMTCNCDSLTADINIHTRSYTRQGKYTNRLLCRAHYDAVRLSKAQGVRLSWSCGSPSVGGAGTRTTTARWLPNRARISVPITATSRRQERGSRGSRFRRGESVRPRGGPVPSA